MSKEWKQISDRRRKLNGRYINKIVKFSIDQGFIN